PAAMLRQLVVDVQAWRNAWYGCTVNGSTPVRLGSDLDDRIAAARAVMDQRRRTLDSFSKTSRISTINMQEDSVTLADEVAQARVLVTEAQNLVTRLVFENADSAQIEQAKQALATRRATYNAALAGYNAEIAAGRAAVATARRTKALAQIDYDRAKASYDALKDQQRDGNGAYVVDGAELPDAYKVLQDICDTAGIEWTTSTVYTTGAPQVAINVHHPAAGTRRDDLVFDTAVNIIGPLELERLEYANAAAGIGAGEGSKAIRETMSVPTERMRRAVTVEDKSAKTRAQIQARLRSELKATTGELFPHSIEVREHPNCPIGAWRVGDLIQIDGVTTIGTRWSGLARVESWSRPSSNRASIQLVPA
ncbi:hypothetical protein PQI23_13855, partial [Leucobacter sp. USCH14]|uniref:hypothetical protein n=1 Tax=Leucobacter sp. USCH14 TaxID=3024838 RepID=UPI0030A9B9F0